MGLLFGVGADADLVTREHFDGGIAELLHRMRQHGPALGVDQLPVHTEADAVYRRTAGGEPAAAGVPTIITFSDQPAAGRFWSIVGLAVLGSDDRTALAGTNVVLCLGDPTAIPPNGSPPRGDVYLPGNQGGNAVGVPANVQFNRHQCVAIPGMQPYVAIYGAAAGQQLAALLYYWDHPLTDQGRVF